MAALDGRVVALMAALERGGAAGIAALVRSRIQDADCFPRADGEMDEDDPYAARSDENDGERGTRHLKIAHYVVENFLMREIALVAAIEQNLEVLRDRSARRDGAFEARQVAVSGGVAEEDAASIAPIGVERAAALNKLMQAWRSAWGMAIEGRSDDVR